MHDKQGQDKRQYKVIVCSYSEVRCCAVIIEYQVQVMVRILWTRRNTDVQNMQI